MTEKHKEYVSTLVCDCCGKKIIDLRFPVCVLNPYECLCMECFRAEHRENARVIKTNANNYRLKKDLENERKAHISTINNMHNNFEKINKKDVESMKNVCNSKFKDMVGDAYYKAVAIDSVGAIAILSELRNKIKELEE